ncbi:MAG: hypothetical protein WBO10_16175 [Pyrinomonadaceae bacterium]
MGVKQCDKCSEMVDEAKAFCPACGNAFVEEEQRSAANSFEKMDSTVQLGQTMYNQMLSDMGLNIERAPEPVEKRVEVIQAEPAAPRAPAKPKAPPASSSNIKWIVLGAAAVVVLAVFLIILAAAAIYWFSLNTG